ncbi:hypothetical protein [Actinomadura macrotermitis]|uniref:Sensor domain-containing protein n=1 Tax=Actinomadura macrotermitis TaxID=2585200 RepID=A0A7K0BV87_9ACTN|nr:hypothetical protein [Actinomadura macrotermitis]MQY04976.1 hypothetical protein [Actinomadura macrotermitis]
MTHRLLPIALLAAAAATTAGCGGGADQGPPAQAAGRAALAGAGYTSDQLEQALLTEPSGYRRAGDPDSGEYGTLAAIQNFDQLQRQVKLDKPRCAAARPGGALDRSVPAAIATFAKKGGSSLTETLLALPDDAAERQVKARVPAGCQTFRTLVGATWSEHEVMEPPPGTLGEGSRTVGVVSTTGGSNTKTWYVVARGRRHLVTISLYGPNATREEAEGLAGQAIEQARRILP